MALFLLNGLLMSCGDVQASYVPMQTNGGFNNGCLIASNFQLSYDPNRWWSCKRHVSDCFDGITRHLKNSLTQGKCRGHACYSKEGVEHLKQQIQVSPSMTQRRANGCALPQFNVGMERMANALLQKADGCLLDVEEYEALLEHVMAGMRAERDCFLQSNPLLTQQLLQLRQNQQHWYLTQNFGPPVLPRYAYPVQKFRPRKCLLPPLVELTLRMRLAQYSALIKPGTLPTWQARSADAYPAAVDNKEWVEQLQKVDMRDPQAVKHAEVSKKVLEEYLRALGCSTEPDTQWSA